MTDNFNPYAPPRSSVEESPLSSGNAAWHIGKVLVLRKDSGLPHRCVKCNEAVVEPIKKFKLYWHHPAWYLLILLNIILYAVVAMVVRKRVVLPIGLCQRHRSRHRLGQWIGWGGSLGMLALAFFGAASSAMSLLAIGLIGFLVSLILGIALSRVVYPTRIDNEYVRMKGCSRTFLNTLPEFPRA